MRMPYGPFLEISFYFSNMPETAVIRLLVKSLLEQGAKFTGIGKAHSGNNINGKPFDLITCSLLHEVSISSMYDVDRVLNDQDKRLIQIQMTNVTRPNPRTVEILTFLSISPEAANYDHHPITIWTEGGSFCGNFPQLYRGRVTQFGNKIYHFFIDILGKLYPDYAAITVEWPLECPYDLHQDPRSLSFKDFYISQPFIGETEFGKIRQEFSTAYQEVVANGVYISGYKYLNPSGIEITPDGGERKSLLVSNLIARRTMGKTSSIK